MSEMSAGAVPAPQDATVTVGTVTVELDDAGYPISFTGDGTVPTAPVAVPLPAPGADMSGDGDDESAQS